MTTFREALDTLCMDASEAAELFGLARQTIAQMRLDAGHANYRRPPDGWQHALAKLAMQKGKALAALANELERDGGR